MLAADASGRTKSSGINQSLELHPLAITPEIYTGIDWRDLGVYYAVVREGTCSVTRDVTCGDHTLKFASTLRRARCCTS